MLAYCTAADLPSGLLIYAAGEDVSGKYRIDHAGKTIEVTSLDLSGTPEAILDEVDHLAERGSRSRPVTLAQGSCITRPAVSAFSPPIVSRLTGNVENGYKQLRSEL